VRNLEIFKRKERKIYESETKAVFPVILVKRCNINALIATGNLPDLPELVLRFVADVNGLGRN
jgi:hypothetical protein